MEMTGKFYFFFDQIFVNFCCMKAINYRYYFSLKYLPCVPWLRSDDDDDTQSARKRENNDDDKNMRRGRKRVWIGNLLLR